MKIIGLICLLLLLKPLITNATELGKWSPRNLYPISDSLDYINDKLFEGVCSIDAIVGHPFCLDDIDLSPELEINTTSALQNDHKPLNHNILDSNSKEVIIPKNYEYKHQYRRNDSVEGGLRFPLFR